MVLKQENRGYGDVGTEFPKDSRLNDDTRVHHDGGPKWKDIEVVREPKWADTVVKDEHNREQISADVEEGGPQPRYQASEIATKAYEVFRVVVVPEVLMDGELDDKPDGEENCRLELWNVVEREAVSQGVADLPAAGDVAAGCIKNVDAHKEQGCFAVEGSEEHDDGERPEAPGVDGEKATGEECHRRHVVGKGEVGIDVDDVAPKGHDEEDGENEGSKQAGGRYGVVEAIDEETGKGERDQREDVESQGLWGGCRGSVEAASVMSEMMHEERRVVDRPHEEDR